MEIASEKYCKDCSRFLPIHSFNYKVKKTGLRQSSCVECKSTYWKSYYKANHEKYYGKIKARRKRLKQELRSRILSYLQSHPCIDCGESDPVVLDFDHVMGDKVSNISLMVHELRNWADVEKEIDKCQIRCANCHRKRHHLARCS